MAPQTLLQHLNVLNSEKLYLSAEMLSGLMMTMLNNGSEGYTSAHRYEVLLNHAHTKYKRKHYLAAEFHYNQALTVRKSGVKQKGMASNFAKLPSENDVKYKLHRCYQGLRDNTNALSILESIPSTQRSVKVHRALAKIYHNMGKTRAAVAAYKEIVKKTPLALDVILNLLTLGENINDIIPFVSSATQGSDWILNLIKGFAFMQNKEYNKSSSLFDGLNRKSEIAGNARLQCLMGHLRLKMGNNKSALMHFEKAQTTDTFLMDDMDILAYLLHEEGEHEKLRNLATRLYTVTESHAAAWVALGYRYMHQENYRRAVYIALEATKIDPHCVQALVLKGCALRAIDEVKDAIVHFREASRIDPTRFICYKELVDTYLSLPKPRVTEAIVVAISAQKSIGVQPNCLVLSALAHMMEPNGKDKALNHIHKALALDPNNQYAIVVKGNILVELEKYEEAIKFLSTCIENHPSSTMFTLLGNCYQKTNDFSKAVDHYMVALSLNPDNKEASEGMGNITKLQRETTFDASDNTDTGQLPRVEDEGNSDSDIMYAEE